MGHLPSIQTTYRLPLAFVKLSSLLTIKFSVRYFFTLLRGEKLLNHSLVKNV